MSCALTPMSAGTSGRLFAVRIRYDIRRELGMRASSTPTRVDLRQHPYVQLGCREFIRPCCEEGEQLPEQHPQLARHRDDRYQHVRGEAARGREADRHARSAAGRGPDGAEGTRAMRDAKYCTGVVRVRPERRPGPTRCGRRATSERRSACRTTSCWSSPTVDGLVNWLTTHLITALRHPAVMRTRANRLNRWRGGLSDQRCSVVGASSRADERQD